MMRRNWLSANVSHGVRTGSWISWKKLSNKKWAAERPGGEHFGKLFTAWSAQIKLPLSGAEDIFGAFGLPSSLACPVVPFLHLALGRQFFIVVHGLRCALDIGFVLVGW